MAFPGQQFGSGHLDPITAACCGRSYGGGSSYPQCADIEKSMDGPTAAPIAALPGGTMHQPAQPVQHAAARQVEGFTQDKKDGSGTYTNDLPTYKRSSTYKGLPYIDRTTHKGQWVNDQQHGGGTEEGKGGAKFTGQYQNGKKHGLGNNEWEEMIRVSEEMIKCLKMLAAERRATGPGGPTWVPKSPSQVKDQGVGLTFDEFVNLFATLDQGVGLTFDEFVNLFAKSRKLNFAMQNAGKDRQEGGVL